MNASYLMLGKVCPWLSILVILCSAVCQSCAGHTWQGLGRGLQVSRVGGRDPHVPLMNGPNQLQCQWEQACSPLGIPRALTLTYLRKSCSHCGERTYEEIGEEKWMGHCWGHGWGHGWRHTLARMCSLPEEGLLRDHGCG